MMREAMGKNHQRLALDISCGILTFLVALSFFSQSVFAEEKKILREDFNSLNNVPFKGGA